MKKARSESAHLLPIQELRWRCDPATLGFETTEVVSPLDGVAGQERAADAIKLALRITAPDYNWNDYKDVNVKGKVVVLDFYATWCEPCRYETPHLVAMQQHYADQGLKVIGLNVGGEDDREEVPKYAKEFNIQYPLGFPDDEFVNAYMSGDQLIPETVVFDRSGKIVKRIVGYDKKGGQELARVVQATLAAGAEARP